LSLLAVSSLPRRRLLPYRRRGSMPSGSPLCSSPLELVHEQPASSPAAEIITVSPPRIAAVQLAAMQPVIGARRL